MAVASTKELLVERLQDAFVRGEVDSVEVNELDGCGDSFEVYVISSAFEGTKRLIQRHSMVNEAVGDLMDRIHALSIKRTATPEEAGGAVAT
jgi:stress-induced morphogen